MTIFDKGELKYTQTDIDVRDVKIEELRRKIRELETDLNYERLRRRVTNFLGDEQLYTAKTYQN